MTREQAIETIIENAKELLQWHLDDFAQHSVDDVDIDALGWGEDCVPIKLLRAYRELKDQEK